MFISFVVAAAKNNVIGKDNQLVWNLPNDMKFFKNVTWGMPVVMGRKSFESLGKALQGRKNIVLTRQEHWKAKDVIVVKTMDEAKAAVKEMDVKEMMVIGGGEIFKMVMPEAKRIYLTRVDAEPEGDAFFPEVNTVEWKLVSKKDNEADNKHAYNYSFQIWERK
jgi:dihydrofolate reductase